MTRVARGNHSSVAILDPGPINVMNTTHPAPPPPQPGQARLGLAIASLILGITGFIFSLLLFGALLGLVGLILGVLHWRRSKDGRGMAGWGIGLGSAAILASIAMGVVFYQTYQTFTEMMEEGGGGTDFSQWEGVPAPDIAVNTLDGERLQLSELRGRRVILDFWATWCPPCVKEIPHFIQLINETSRDDLVIVGISDEDEATLREFVGKHGVNYPTGGPASELASPYADVTAIPTTFFIDRQGVIQFVLEGYHDLGELRTRALAEDYSGPPRSAPRPLADELPDAPVTLPALKRWSRPLPAVTLNAGDWDGDGREDLLVVERGGRLRVLAADGVEKASVKLPGEFSAIELGRHREHGVRLLGYSNWGREVTVMDDQGRKLWAYPSGSGVNGAHWGDLDGDGSDEMIVGMNGGGGLHAVAADGKQLWRVGSLGNVWNQAIVPAVAGQPVLIFATEAGGSVRVFDAKGRALRTIRPLGEYFSQMSAARVDAAGTVQVVVQREVTVALDETGKTAWQTPAIKDHGSWRKASFASGDLTGDGTREWVFLDAAGNLAVVTPEGGKVATVKLAGVPSAFTVLAAKDGAGRLVVLRNDEVEAYDLE